MLPSRSWFSYRECKKESIVVTSVMFDGSKMPLKKNSVLALKFLILHKYNISVEGEIGEVGYFGEKLYRN